MALTRRNVLLGAGAVGLSAGAVTAAGKLEAFFSNDSQFNPSGLYGPLRPDPDGLLDLPEGFSYRVLSREGRPLAGGKGTAPSCFDGMAVFDGPTGDVLVRNHECQPDAPHRVAGDASLTYDRGGPGGTTTVVLDGSGMVADEYVSLAGTVMNCAGGSTPWRTWLSCEETEARRGEEGYEKDHGWVFEVDPLTPSRNAVPTPLTGLGRFPHEALCVDPGTGIVYLTEDASDPLGCFYRFTPDKPLGGYGSLRAGGSLSVMRVPGVPDLSAVVEPGAEFPGVEWVEVPDPSAAGTPTRMQLDGTGAVSRARKLEGAWWGGAGAYFVSSYARRSDGSARNHDGQVWRYDPERHVLRLEVILATKKPGADRPFQGPDNICVAPEGGLLVCQDSEGENFVMGLSRTGRPYVVARNRQAIRSGRHKSYGEMAGVMYSARTRTLYLNCYEPGTTFAVVGDWSRTAE